jgi:hypothetical protein
MQNSYGASGASSRPVRRHRSRLLVAAGVLALGTASLTFPTSVGASVGSASNEADTAMGVAAARTTYGIDGTGVSVGVVADGVDGLVASQTAGDLGTVTVLPALDGTGDQGTMMLEAIHDLAPGAALTFATSGADETAMAASIGALVVAGVDIIVDGGSFASEPSLRIGGVGSPVAQAVAAASAVGVITVTPVGDDLGVWQGDIDASALPDPAPLAGANLHDFDPGGGDDIAVPITQANATITLEWADPWATSANDYDVYLMDSTGTTILDASTAVQDGAGGNDFPIEVISGTYPAGSLILIDKFSGADRFLRLTVEGGITEFATSGEIGGHGTTADFSVAAASAASGTLFTGAATTIASSNIGPRRAYFDSLNAPITPGNFSSTGGILLQQPDVTAGSEITTSLGTFSGTPAAAADLAGILALVREAAPASTTGQIQTAVTSATVDIMTAGVDASSGFGIPIVSDVLEALGVSVPPNAVDDNIAVAEDAPATAVAVLANDTDPDSTLTVTSNTQPAHGAVTCSTTSCSYTPAANYHGPDSFTYTITGDGETDTATVDVAVSSVNDAPVAVADSVSTATGTAATFDPRTNDTDVDGDSLNIVSPSDPARGSVTCSATSCTYTPDPGTSGTDTFTYRVSDGTATSATVTVTVTVGAQAVTTTTTRVSANPSALPRTGSNTPFGPVGMLFFLGGLALLASSSRRLRRA